MPSSTTCCSSATTPVSRISALLLSAPSPERERVAAKLPTGALVTIELDEGWAAVETGAGRIVALVVPRELCRG